MLRFAVIGHPVAHSLSPRIHAANFRALGIEAAYDAVDVAPADLAAALRRFAADGFRGINVTVPHKVAVKELVDRVDSTAHEAGAVNTVLFAPDGSTTGFNTDMAGFLHPLKAMDFPFASAKVLVIGAGGASRAVMAACRAAGCAVVTQANRTARPGMLQLGSDECLAAARSADLVVNATTVGLREGDPCVIAPDVFRAGQLVYDLIPVARETATLAAARAAGARTLDGLGMLAAQAAESFRIWTGRVADLSAMLAALGRMA